MLLAIMIGNANVRVGLFKDGELHATRFDSATLRAPSWYASRVKELMDAHGVSDVPVVLGSVVKDLSGVVAEGAAIATGSMPFIATYAHAAPLRLDVERPEALGIDRIAVAVAAEAHWGSPLAVVDFGTATTVNFVDDGPVFLGGAILPGLGLMGRSMGRGTAALPEIEPRATGEALGRDTGPAMLSGIIFGTAGAVMRIIEEVRIARSRAFSIAATGGYASLVVPHMGGVSFTEPELALRGLRLMYEGHTHA